MVSHSLLLNMKRSAVRHEAKGVWKYYEVREALSAGRLVAITCFAFGNGILDLYQCGLDGLS